MTAYHPFSVSQQCIPLDEMVLLVIAVCIVVLLVGLLQHVGLKNR